MLASDYSSPLMSPSPYHPAAPYLDALNPPQREAVMHGDGPLLVLAGAGTGKTRVLTARIAHLLLSGQARPAEILAATFTNKAAREMRERIESIIGQPVEGLWFGTFHSLCGRILRRHAELAGLSPQFIIIDADDQLRLLKQLMEEHGIDEKRWPPRAALAIVQGWKDRGLVPDKVSAGERTGFADGRILMLYRAYQERLRRANAVDFGDLILSTLELFLAHPDVLEQYSHRFRHILVDEYQDTNVAQYLWLRLLAMAHKNICCVGDDDQSIYGWRGAEVGNILRFEQDFPGAAVIRLEQNYRSTSHILAAASALIAHNRSRHGKTLWCDDPEGGGDKVHLCSLWDDNEEARYIGEQVETLQRRGMALRNMAVLVRAGFQTRAFEERFMSLGVPYAVVGGLRFYERQEIRDVIAYLRLIRQPQDDLALQRIINLPKRGIGKATLDSIQHTAREYACALYHAIQLLQEQGGFKPAMTRTFSALLDQFAGWRKQAETLTLPALLEAVLTESGYRAMWQTSRGADAPGRLENLKELIRAVEAFNSLDEFLEHVSLVMDMAAAQNDDMLSIMTLHAAKGLEFDAVFLPGWEEGLFPSQRTLDEHGVKGLEEERRLAYVGITRARRHVWITHAHNRRIYNQWQNSLPSRFIAELPATHTQQEASPSGHTRFGGGQWNATVDELFATARQRSAALASATESGGARKPETIAGSAGGVTPGMRVHHAQFGYGKVVGRQGDRLDVAFDNGGIKKVMQDYVTPA